MDREQGSGSLEVVIDADSIDTNHEKRDNHMRSPDFLNAVEFPEITFKSTEVSFEGEDKATVTGDLTVLGVTKPVTLDVINIVCGTHIIYNYEACGFEASATLKRSDFGNDLRPARCGRRRAAPVFIDGGGQAVTGLKMHQQFPATEDVAVAQAANLSALPWKIGQL